MALARFTNIIEQVKTYDYYKSGRIKNVIDYDFRVGSDNENEIHYLYDANGNNINEFATYLDENNLISIHELASIYDSNNRRIRTTIWDMKTGSEPSTSSRLSYVYDANGNRQNVNGFLYDFTNVDPLANPMEFDYWYLFDDMDRVIVRKGVRQHHSEVTPINGVDPRVYGEYRITTSSNNDSIATRYDRDGRITRTYARVGGFLVDGVAPSIQIKYEYNSSGMLKRQTNYRYGEPIRVFEKFYDEAGNVKTEIQSFQTSALVDPDYQEPVLEEQRRVNYYYNLYNQLVNESAPGEYESNYKYDEMGNVLSIDRQSLTSVHPQIRT